MSNDELLSQCLELLEYIGTDLRCDRVSEEKLGLLNDKLIELDVWIKE